MTAEADKAQSAEQQKTLPTVWVIGGGITGLTVAHEMMERGFTVRVVEREQDPRHLDFPALGGMAKSQWTLLPRSGDGPLQSTVRLIPPPRLEFLDDELTEPTQEALREWGKKLAEHGIKHPLELVRKQGDETANESTRSRAPRVVAFLRDNGILLPVTDCKEPPDDGEQSGAVQLRFKGAILPGEHGFRFFHSFYRHVFDTMMRIAVLPKGSHDFESAFRTVYDNLSPSDCFMLDLEKPARSVEFPRQRVTSIQQLFDTLRKFMTIAGHSTQDLSKISIKILKYMTSCSARREQEYEEISWWDFIDGPAFGEIAQKHHENAPQVLVGLSATRCDARTQGNVVTQMLMGQMNEGPHADATLNAPTTSAWFVPWRDYLHEQGVEFSTMSLEDFTVNDSKDRIFPRFSSPQSAQFGPDDMFVLAVALPDMIGEEAGTGLMDRFIKAHESLTVSTPINDLTQLRSYSNGVFNWNDPSSETADKSPLRHMNGIQFFFESEVPQKVGRSLYLDSDWRLSSLTQVAFWHRRRSPTEGYRGILSVDIGAWHTPNTAGRTAWMSTPDQIAADVWEQITATITPDDLRPNALPWKPSYYHIDDCIVFQPAPPTPGEVYVPRWIKPIKNEAPYLVTRPGDWKLRPGRLDKTLGYEVQASQWMLAGTYMKTFTRLTTMESANESGRHAVNGLLFKCDPQGTRWPRCRVWDPETMEFPDLRWLKDLDQKLFDLEDSSSGNQLRLPHFLDILDLEELPEWLLNSTRVGDARGWLETTMLKRYFSTR